MLKKGSGGRVWRFGVSFSGKIGKDLGGRCLVVRPRLPEPNKKVLIQPDML